MQIPVMVEPAFMHSFWCQQTLNGIYAEAKQKKYLLKFIDGSPSGLTEEKYQTEDTAQFMVIVGTSLSWIPQVLKFLEQRDIRAILINFDSFARPSCHSVVRMDYVDAMQQLMGYFYHYGRNRIALFGINANSSADRLKEQYFCSALRDRGITDPQSMIYRNHGQISACFSQLFPDLDQYDAVICANDIVAVAALQKLSAKGVSVPQRIQLAGFGESSLSDNVHPSITCATLDHEKMGRQAVMLYAYLKRQDSPVTVSVRVKTQLIVRQSTACLPNVSDPYGGETISPLEPIDFYGDDTIRELLLLDDFYGQCDDLDLHILHDLAGRISLEQIAERCHSTISTIGYRLRNMQQRTGTSSRGELIQKTINPLDCMRNTEELP
ncbi:MAG: substrate-binding domain-containing protein [Eubacteriales bacterium]|nr:substrate-binding domain-containing protein [Eubacteriales bacterium]